MTPLLRSLLGALAVAGGIVSPDPGSASSPPRSDIDSQELEHRVMRVKVALLEMEKQVDVSVGESRHLTQWMNWPNWPNWRNFWRNG
ncbi:MAG TPA: hypothetical protein PK177_07810 [Burkholderiaceae bacterium]|nr:hypothetical protein [Burkholderiaceae bacterium]